MGYWVDTMKEKAAAIGPNLGVRADLLATALLLDKAGLSPSVSDGIEVLHTNGHVGYNSVVEVLTEADVEYGAGMPDHPKRIVKSPLWICSDAETPGLSVAAMRRLRILYLLDPLVDVPVRLEGDVSRTMDIAMDEPFVLAYYAERFGTPASEDVGLEQGSYDYMTVSDIVWASRHGEDGFIARLRELCPENPDDKLPDAEVGWKFKARTNARTNAKKPAANNAAVANVVFPDGNKKLSEMSGFGEAGKWGMRLAEDLRLYARGELAWSEVDKGVLLTSPPGGGKSTFAKALAAECGLPLYVSTYADWEGQTNDRTYVVATMQKAFTAWRKAAENGPIIVFCDEIDSIGARGQNGRNEGYWAPIINAVLAFLDGAVSREGIVMIAATNYSDRVDPALKRPGRLDREIAIPRPDVAALAGIVAHHLNVDAAAQATRDAARLLRGRSPAEVEFACREVRRLKRIFKRAVDATDLVDMLKAGREKVSPDQDKTIRFHEAGHAIAALAVGRKLISIDVDRVDTATLRIDGHVISDDGPALQTRIQQIREMAFCLAGRASEDVHLGYATVGAEGDLKAATYIASRTIRQHGLDGDLIYYHPEGLVSDEHVARIRVMLDEAYAMAVGIVRSWETRFLAECLTEARYMTGDEVLAAIRSAIAEAFFPAEEGPPEPERYEPSWEDSCPPEALAA